MKTITIKSVVSDQDSSKIFNHLKQYIESIEISYYNDVNIKPSTNKEKNIYSRIANAFEQKFQVGVKVKLCKKGLNHNSLLNQRPNIRPETIGVIIGVTFEGFMFPYLVKFGEDKIYCSFYEIEEV